MNCARVRKLLPDYTVELLSRGTRRTVEAHLRACAECRDELAALNAVGELVETYGAVEPPPGLFHAVRQQIEAGSAPRERSPWWAFLYGRPARALAMGMAMGAVVLGLVIPVSQSPVPSLDIAVTPTPTGMVTTSALASSIRQHAMSAGDGPLTDRVAWEAMAQLVSQETEQGN